MSLTAADPTLAPATTGRPSRALLISVGLACALVLASGAARWWRARRVEAALALGRESPFPLDSLPMTLGDWVGAKTDLDPEIVAGTGSSDLITRRFVNQTTGVALDVIVLYGPASDIFVHSPDWCYPRAGHSQYGDAKDRTIRGLDGPVPFRSIAYSKGDPGHVGIQEVYYSWRYNGHWDTVVNRPKELQRVPGMYKVQVARRILPDEARALDDPCEAFLEELVPVLEARIMGRTPPTQAASSPDAPGRHPR